MLIHKQPYSCVLNWFKKRDFARLCCFWVVIRYQTVSIREYVPTRETYYVVERDEWACSGAELAQSRNFFYLSLGCLKKCKLCTKFTFALWTNFSLGVKFMAGGETRGERYDKIKYSLWLLDAAKARKRDCSFRVYWLCRYSTEYIFKEGT